MKNIYFVEGDLSCTSIVGAVKEEVGCCFIIMTTAANEIYAVLRGLQLLLLGKGKAYHRRIQNSVKHLRMGISQK